MNTIELPVNIRPQALLRILLVVGIAAAVFGLRAAFPGDTHAVDTSVVNNAGDGMDVVPRDGTCEVTASSTAASSKSRPACSATPTATAS